MPRAGRTTNFLRAAERVDSPPSNIFWLIGGKKIKRVANGLTDLLRNSSRNDTTSRPYLMETLKNCILAIFQATKRKCNFRFAHIFQAVTCLKNGGVSLPRTGALNFSRRPHNRPDYPEGSANLRSCSDIGGVRVAMYPRRGIITGKSKRQLNREPNSTR